MEYYINTGIHSEGPYTIDSLREKHITPDTFVLPQGTDRWMPAGQVEELQSLFVVQSVEPQYQQVVDSYQQRDNQQAGSEELVQPIQDGSNSPENNSSANTIFCNNCGKQIKEGFKFCTKCGAPVKVVIEKTAKSEVLSNSFIENELDIEGIKKKASQGDKKAMLRQAFRYEKGIGVEYSLVESAMLYSKVGGPLVILELEELSYPGILGNNHVNSNF